jgi:hypothetical protein
MRVLINPRNFFQTVKLIIGKGEQQVVVNVPKDRLCDVSEFFSAGCSDRWASGREGVIELEDEDPKVFSLFIAWAFDGGVQNSEDYILIESADREARKQSSIQRHSQLVECYILSERLLAFDFKNAVMNLIIQSYKSNSVEFNIINRIYECTPVGSPLRRSLVHRSLQKLARVSIQNAKANSLRSILKSI